MQEIGVPMEGVQHAIDIVRIIMGMVQGFFTLILKVLEIMKGLF